MRDSVSRVRRLARNLELLLQGMSSLKEGVECYFSVSCVRQNRFSSTRQKNRLREQMSSLGPISPSGLLSHLERPPSLPWCGVVSSSLPNSCLRDRFRDGQMEAGVKVEEQPLSRQMLMLLKTARPDLS